MLGLFIVSGNNATRGDQQNTCYRSLNVEDYHEGFVTPQTTFELIK